MCHDVSESVAPQRNNFDQVAFLGGGGGGGELPPVSPVNETLLTIIYDTSNRDFGHLEMETVKMHIFFWIKLTRLLPATVFSA